jgi:hypothetical protein
MCRRDKIVKAGDLQMGQLEPDWMKVVFKRNYSFLKLFTGSANAAIIA